MQQYNYLLGKTESQNTVFVVTPHIGLSGADLAKKMAITTITCHGKLESTDPAYTLRGDCVAHQPDVDALCPNRFFTGKLNNFGTGNGVFFYCTPEDEITLQRCVTDMSSAWLDESSLVFDGVRKVA